MNSPSTQTIIVIFLSFLSFSLQNYYSLSTDVSTVEPPNELTFIRSVVEEAGNFAAEKIYGDLPNRSPTTRLTLKKINYEESLMSEAHYFSLLLSNSSSSQAYQLEMLDLLRPRALWLGLPAPNEIENEHDKQITMRQLFERSLRLEDLTLPGPLELYFNRWGSKRRQEVSLRLPHEIDLEMKEVNKIIIDQNVEHITIKNLDSVQLLSPLQLTLRKEEDSTAMQQVVSLEDLERILTEDETQEKVIFEWKETPKLVVGGRSIMLLSSGGQKLKVKKKAEGVLEIFDPSKPRTSAGDKKERRLEVQNIKKRGFLASLFSMLGEKGMESQLDGRTRGFKLNFQQGHVEVVYYFLLPLIVEIEEEQSNKEEKLDQNGTEPPKKKVRRMVQYRTYIMMSSDGSKKLVKYEQIEAYQNMISFSQSLLLNGTLVDAIPDSLKAKMENIMSLPHP